MADNPIIGELFRSVFLDGAFNFRDNSLIFYSKYEEVITIVGSDISELKNEIDALIGGTP